MKHPYLLVLLLLALRSNVASQVIKTIPIDLTPANCLKEADTNSSTKFTNNILGIEDTTVTLIFTFSSPKEAKNADKKYLLKNIVNNSRIQGTMKEGNLVFKLTDLFTGTRYKAIQLVNAVDTSCYSSSFYITEKRIVSRRNLKTTTKKDPTGLLPDLNLPHYTIGTDPCNSCEPQGNKIIYDFSSNSLKNLKTQNSTSRAFEKDYLNSRWTKLPRVGEELVFEVTNVNPFKYDITLTDEPVSYNTEAPAFLTTAFSPKEGISAASEDETDSLDAIKEKFVEALNKLNNALDSKIAEFRNGGDCFNPCALIRPAVEVIVKYFTDNLGFDKQTTLEGYLTSMIDNNFDAKADSAKIKELNAVVKKYYDFRNSAVGTFSYRIPQLKNVDQYLFKLNITPKEGVQAGARVLNQDIAVDVLGGFKVDVTSGLFFTKLADEKYILRGDSTVIRTASGYADSIVFNRRNKVIRENGSDWDFGVAAFFHFYPKISSKLNMSFSLGAGTTLSEKPKLRYLAGGSLLIGKTNRIAFTYGMTMGFVDQLSNRYSDQKDALGNIYTSQTDTKIDMKKYFKTSPFISLTYSIPLMKKKEEVKAAPAAEEKPAETDKPAEETKPESKK